MSRIIAALLAGLAAIAAFFAMAWQRGRAKAARRRAERAEAVVEQQQRVDDARAEVEARHRQEDADAAESVKTGDRDHLDKPW